MLFGKDSFRKKNMGKYIIGYELARDHVQISYLKIGEKEPETLSTIAGQEQYNIPFVLYKQEDKNLWYIGKEALSRQQELGGILVSNLLENAYQKEMTEVNLETYDSSALLALFVKRSLSPHYLPSPERYFMSQVTSNISIYFPPCFWEHFAIWRHWHFAKRKTDFRGSL